MGGTGDLIDKNYFVNGRPIPPDFHGGEENFRSVDYMGIPVPPAQTLATMIFDGVLEAFPNLHIGVIEQGAIWVPSWLRQMESAFEAFRRHEERLQALSLSPSEYVHRQVRFTPYPTEDVGWIVDQAGADLVLFSSDYPHVEGGRKPLERFEASLGDRSEEVRRQFYTDNFLFLMGQRGRGAGGLSRGRIPHHHGAGRAGLRGRPGRIRQQLRTRPRAWRCILRARRRSQSGRSLRRFVRPCRYPAVWARGLTARVLHDQGSDSHLCQSPGTARASSTWTRR